MQWGLRTQLGGLVLPLIGRVGHLGQISFSTRGSENAVRGSFFHYVYPLKNAVTVVQLMDFTEFAAMHAAIRPGLGECGVHDAGVAGRQGPGRWSRSRADCTVVQDRGGWRRTRRRPHGAKSGNTRSTMPGWMVHHGVCVDRADVRTQSSWTECCADIAAIQDRVRPEVPEAPGGFVLLRL